MSTDNIYRHALNELSNSECSIIKLRRMKETYKNEIDSERLFERIATIADLLRTLDKRNCISDNVFKHMCTELNRTDIITAIDTGRISGIDTVHVPAQAITNRTCKVLPDVPVDPDRRVVELISSQMGKKWKDFARALEIGEGHIDELQATYRDRTFEIVFEVLKYHKDSSDQNYWKFYLCSALEKARRKDLSEYVQKIYARDGVK